MMNSTYKNKNANMDMTKFQIMRQKIERLENEIEKKKHEIERLDHKEEFYLKEIESLRIEHENNKKRVLDEGNALGFAKPVPRQFFK
jgi:ribosomal 30S subunit maturation factor RimM